MSLRLSQSTAPSEDVSRCRIRPPGSLRTPVSGLLFDTGDVLYDATAWRRWLLKLLSRLGLHTNYCAFFRVWDQEFMADVYRGRREFWEAFRTFLRSAGLSAAQVGEVEVSCRNRRLEWETTARPLPGVKATLGSLYGAGLRLGAIANSERPASAMVDQLERFGVGGIFSAAVSSIDLAWIMPEAVCYQSALDAMDLRAESVAFVGHDSLELAGAAKVGMQTIAFNYDRDAEADVFLSRFEDLVEVVCSRPPYAAAG